METIEKIWKVIQHLYRTYKNKGERTGDICNVKFIICNVIVQCMYMHDKGERVYCMLGCIRTRMD